ncbi:hypothetical protein TWF481_002854 [Arthrobotrys musiformis]|uniref:Uncharacterized protein n=1 Tax=Arthrobotrys musiformis TaxID=47236 RepID=A0AAV9VSJ0_9PEZI
MGSYPGSQETMGWEWFKHGFPKAESLNILHRIWRTRRSNAYGLQYIIQTPVGGSLSGCLQDDSVVPDDFYRWSGESALTGRLFPLRGGGLLSLWFAISGKRIIPIITALYPTAVEESSVKPLHDIIGSEILMNFIIWSSDQRSYGSNIAELAGSCLENRLRLNDMERDHDIRKVMVEFKEALENNDEDRITKISTKKEYATYTLRVMLRQSLEVAAGVVAGVTFCTAV